MKMDVFETLYKEICVIKSNFTKNENYTFRRSNEAEGIEYLVILNNNTMFYISIGTDILPEFSKEDVVYIREKIDDITFIDTEVGFFNTDDQLTHAVEMEKKFNVLYNFDTHCYD